MTPIPADLAVALEQDPYTRGWNDAMDHAARIADSLFASAQMAAEPQGGADPELALRLHLGSRHALANWPDATAIEAEHTHEHDGPGTIRNHPRDDRSFDLVKALVGWVEGQEMDGDESPIARYLASPRARSGRGAGCDCDQRRECYDRAHWDSDRQDAENAARAGRP